MVGVAAGLSQNGNVGNRSMLVHPSQLTIQHQEFYSWVRDIFEEWKRVLNLDDSELDKQDLLEEVRLAYDDLRQTVDDLPEFEALCPLFRLAFRNTTLLQVNASGGRTPKVEWAIPTAGYWLAANQWIVASPLKVSRLHTCREGSGSVTPIRFSSARAFSDTKDPT